MWINANPPSGSNLNALLTYIVGMALQPYIIVRDLLRDRAARRRH